MAGTAKETDSKPELRKRVEQAEIKADRQRRKTRRSRKDAKSRKREVEAMRASLSWRLTAPLRLLGGPLRGRVRRTGPLRGRLRRRR